MKNREYFLREDLNTYKPKFLSLCNKCEFKVAYVKDKLYLCNQERKSTIKIIEL